MNYKKKAFTLLEVVLVIVIVSGGLVTVITALNKGNGYLQRSREKIIAINLAREGVEQMINIRDTNRKKNAGKKEETRLQINPMDDSIDSRFSSGYYIILPEIKNGQQYFYGSGTFEKFDPTQGLSTNNLKYALCQTTGGRIPCPGNQTNSAEGRFFRSVHGIGLYKKLTDTYGGEEITCKTSSNNPDCSDTSAKEYRFCVVVDYFGETINKVELCSVITNFK